MLKLSNQVIDVYDDVMLEGIKKVASLNPQIAVMTPSERSSLKDRDFALSVITKKASKLNKFPVHNSDDTWLSNHYFDMNCHKLPTDAAKIAAFHIKKACEKFKIEPSRAVSELAKEAKSNIYFETGDVQPSQRVVSADLTKIAAVDDIANNYSHAQYAFATPAHVKVAAEYFEQQAAKMPSEVRHKYAAAIQMRAKELGMPPQKGLVSKYASDHYSPLVDAHVRARAALLETADPALRSTLEKIAKLKTEFTPSQFAQSLHAFDKKAKLDRYYGGHLTDPFQATFGSAPDPYAGYRYKTASDRTLTHEELRAIVGSRFDKIAEYFGKHVAEEMRKDPIAIFDSLPNDAKEMIASFGDGTL